ncbi:MAG: HlyD family efflux transporter periplasmic adaptor subunit [Gemmatimonadota bacterium]|jgi:HlyD family secretion protein|nr:HlyD family efflux transporter periplasmic adaptor subunit [Gemmatimonadota bacterium]
MPPDLTPFDLVEDSAEVYLNRDARSGSTIYLAVIAMVALAIAALPLIHVGVSIQADGVIRPAMEKHTVTAGVSGYVKQVTASAYAEVQAGDVLFQLRGEPMDARRELARTRLAELGDAIRELEWLVNSGTEADPRRIPLREGRQLAEHRLFLQELAELDARKRQVEGELTRVISLAGRGLASRAEEERSQRDAEVIGEERLLIVERYRGSWQERLEQLQLERARALEDYSMLAEDSVLRVIRAPVTGTLEEIASVSPGSYVSEGQQLAVISPSAELVAEVYLSPRDIGLLDRDTPARLLVDAFPWRDWGHLTGHVSEFPEDYLMVGDRAVFRTIVALDDTDLKLSNGFRREVRKGMTFRARFMVAERSLWQLLRDDVNRWVNPLERPARPQETV